MNHNDFNMSHEDFLRLLRRIKESIKRMGLDVDPKMDALADEYSARIEKGRKSVPLETREEPNEHVKGSSEV